MQDVYKILEILGSHLEFLIPPGNTGSLLEFSWFLWKFLTDGMTTKASMHKIGSSPVV